jgi:hypothetical protein
MWVRDRDLAVRKAADIWLDAACAGCENLHSMCVAGSPVSTRQSLWVCAARARCSCRLCWYKVAVGKLSSLTNIPPLKSQYIAWVCLLSAHLVNTWMKPAQSAVQQLQYSSAARWLSSRGSD